jgi:hypothetical protein
LQLVFSYFGLRLNAPVWRATKALFTGIPDNAAGHRGSKNPAKTLQITPGAEAQGQKNGDI